MERATAQIHTDLLVGTLKPNAKLRVQELVKRYGIGATPIREALSRLSPLGFVQPLGNRGFRAAPLSEPDLHDITLARRVNEVAALRIAIERGDTDWEAAIVGALYRLKAGNRKEIMPDELGELAFDRIHKAFHMTLIAACGSERLIEQCGVLYDQAYRYRQIMMRNVRLAPDFYDEHEKLAEKVLARDIEAACEHLACHLGKTLSAVYPANA